MLCRNRVEDFGRWKAVFDSHAEAHREAGLVLRKLWTRSDDPLDVYFLFEVADVERARAFVDDPASADAGKRAGVIDGEIVFLDVVPDRRDEAGDSGGTSGRQLISSGSTFEREIGYSRAVVDGEWIFMSGTTGFDYSTMTISESLTEQAEQCFRNIEAALAEAGASLRDVVRVMYILRDGDEFPDCWPILRKYFGDVRPASTMISAGLSDPRMRIEIQVTARRRA
jgi:enamine deaminase RidA (YjgF/YER057c/UK114 family)